MGAAKVFSKGDAQSRALSQLSTCEHKSTRDEIAKTEQKNKRLKKLSGTTPFHE